MNTTSRTLYVRNLNQKLTVNKLKNGLEKLFNSSGFKVLNIQASKNQGLRGQAFVSFTKDVIIEEVIDKLNTEMLFDMPIILQVAKTDSDSVSQENLDEKQFQTYIKKQRLQRLHNRNKKDINAKKRKLDADGENDKNTQQTISKSNNTKRVKETPNKMMILTLLPNDTTQEMLTDIFSKFLGFLTVNYVAARHLALLEFQTEQNAIDCRESLGSTIKVGDKMDCLLTFAKK